MRMGTFLSYAGGFAETVDELADFERAGLDIVFVPEAYSFDAVSQLGFLARQDRADADRLRHPPAVLAHARDDRDDRGRARLRLGRPVHARPGRVRPAGDRGLARRAVRRADRPVPRDHRDLPDGLAARPAGLPGPVLPPAAGGGHRAGQAAQADQPPGPRADPDRAGRHRPEERGARRRAGRVLDADLLPAGEGRRGVGRCGGRGPRQARPGARPAGRDRARPAGHRRRRDRPARPRPARAGPVHRRDGRPGPQLLQRPGPPVRLRGRGQGHPGRLPGRPQGRGRGPGARRAGRADLAHRPGGLRRRAPGRLPRVRRHHPQRHARWRPPTRPASASSSRSARSRRSRRGRRHGLRGA